MFEEVLVQESSATVRDSHFKRISIITEFRTGPHSSPKLIGRHISELRYECISPDGYMGVLNQGPLPASDNTFTEYLTLFRPGFTEYTITAIPIKKAKRIVKREQYRLGRIINRLFYG